jgi:RNA polymerase sigma factor (sigma-70 family)
MMNVDMELVRAYANGRSEQAFATLVTRYVNFVYSAALRQVRDTHLAEEITQAVFVVLARKAGTLGANTILPSWLYRTAGYCAADAWKTRRRRAQREQEAYMQSLSNEPESETWLQIAPLLDNAIAGLNEKDRHAIVLRYFQNKSLNEVGAALGGTEEAAKKRVARALEKLRAYFSRFGVHSTAETIAGAVSANAVIVAPATLAKTTTAAVLAKSATASASTLTLTKGALKVMAWTHAQTVAVIGTVVLIAAGTTALVVRQESQDKVPIDLPKSSWVFAGYGSPAATIETMEWATLQTNGQAVLAGLTPDCQEDFREYLAQKKPGVTVAQFLLDDNARRQSHLSGIRIVQTEELSTNQVLVEVSSPGNSSSNNQWLKFKKLGDNWEVDDLDPKGPNGRTGLEHFNVHYGGVGIAIATDPGSSNPRITKVLPSLALSQTNLVPGLILQKINGTSTTGKGLGECIFLTRGRVGTDVVLEIYDRERRQTNIVELTRNGFSMADSITLGWVK